MADYDLGTAHGRIIVDYDDKGIGQAEKSFDRLKSKTKELLGQFADVAKNWKAHAQSIQDGAEGAYQKFVRFGQGAAIAGIAVSALNKNILGVGSGIKILGDLGTALGNLPKGAERYPSVVRRIIQVSAAVTLFHGATGLLARATRNISGISTLTRGLAGFGGVLNNLASPLRFVASAALGVLTVLKGFQLVKQYAKYALGFTAALGTLGGALQVIAGVSRAISELSGVVGLLPAVAGAAGLAFATLKIGLSGVGKAIKSGDLSKLAPEARAFVSELRGMKSEFNAIKLDVQNRLFAGLGKVIGDLGGLYLPIVQARLGAVATSFNRAAKDVAAFFNNKKQANEFGKALDDNARTVDNLTKTFEPLVRIFVAVWKVGSKVLADLTSGLGDAAKRAADFVEKAAATGKLEAWIKRGLNAVGDLYFALRNLGQIAGIVFRGLGIGAGQQSFLEWLKQATQGVKDFLLSAQGQQILADFGRLIANAQEHLSKLADVFLTHVLPAIQAFLPFWERIGGAVIDGIVAGLTVLAPLFKALGETLSLLAPALGPIVTAMVFLGTIFLGLGIAAKIAGGALVIFRTAALGLKAIEGIAGLLGRLGGAFRALPVAAKALKFGVIAAGLFLVADGINEMNLKAVGGDTSKLNDMEQTLNDIVTIKDKLLAGDWSWFGDQLNDIADEWGQLTDGISQGTSPVGEAFKFLESGFNDFITTTQTTFGEIGGFFAGLWADISGWLGKIGTSFMTDFVQPILDLPTTVGNAISGLGASIGAKASEIWTSFLTGAQAAFEPVKQFFSQTPFQMGEQIGMAIGDMITAGINLVNSLLMGAQQGWAGFMAWLSTLLPTIGTALANFGAFLWQQAVTAWEQFRAGAEQKGNEAVQGAQELPAKIGNALTGLVTTVGQKAQEAWEGFKTWTVTKTNEAIAWIQAFPGKAGAALSSLAGILAQKASEALQSFLRGVQAGAESALAFVRSIPGRIQSAIGNLGGLLVSAGRAVIDGLLAGIRAGVQAMYDFVSGIAAGIAARKGPLPYDKKLLIPAGLAIVGGLVKGMQQAMPGLWRQVGTINSGLAGIGGVAGSINLNGTASTSGVTSGLTAPAFTGGRVRGGDGASSGVINNFNGTVEIPAKDVAEMQNVAQFFGAVQQKARAGKATK